MGNDSKVSTLAQLLFAAPPEINFAHVVAELDQALADHPSDRRDLRWDNDDLAVFTLDGLRVVLAYSDDLPGAHAACLTLGLGPHPDTPANGPEAEAIDTLRRQLADRLSRRYRVDEVLWHETDRALTPDLIEDLLARLSEPPPLTELPVGEDIDRLLARMAAEMNSRDTPPPMNFARPDADSELGPTVRHVPVAPPANRVPDLPRPKDAELDRIREALYAEDPTAARRQQSVPMRLAVHAMNATMVVVFLPVGMAAMAHGIVRGEDMRRSAQAMALLGLFTTALGGHGMTGLGLL